MMAQDLDIDTYPHKGLFFIGRCKGRKLRE
jgi:hypothetical protein